ncbi:unnamed protein product, partial [Phaeothamnion confervicola]
AIVGHDLSTVPQCEKAGQRYFDLGGGDDDTTAEPPERILRRHGATHIRLRLWVDPPPGYSDLPSVLSFARRVVVDEGMKLLLCLHLSDTWADPGANRAPTVWHSLEPAALAETVGIYVETVVRAFVDQGTPPDIVAVGNEIANGFLWPIGTLNRNRFADGATCLRRGLDAVRKGWPAARTMVHCNNGENKEMCGWFIDLLASYDVEYDFLGLSFYPEDCRGHCCCEGSLRLLEASLVELARRTGKPLIVVETAHSGVWSPSHDSSSSPLRCLRRLAEVVAAVPGGLGRGVFYWEPAWLPGGEAYPGQGWHVPPGRALWAADGRARPAIAAFDGFAAAAASAA